MKVFDEVMHDGSRAKCMNGLKQVLNKLVTLSASYT